VPLLLFASCAARKPASLGPLRVKIGKSQTEHI
jgi:hypothetical protein